MTLACFRLKAESRMIVAAPSPAQRERGALSRRCSQLNVRCDQIAGWSEAWRKGGCRLPAPAQRGRGRGRGKTGGPSMTLDFLSNEEIVLAARRALGQGPWD